MTEQATIFNASNELKQLANKSRNIIALDDAVSAYGSIEAAVAEASARLDKAKLTESAYMQAIADKISAADAYAASGRQGADIALSVAQTRCAAILADANTQAANLAAAAKQAAIDIVSGAKRDLAKFNDAVATARTTYDDLASKLDTLKSAYTSVQASIVSQQSELDRVNGLIAEARAKLGA